MTFINNIFFEIPSDTKHEIKYVSLDYNTALKSSSSNSKLSAIKNIIQTKDDIKTKYSLIRISNDEGPILFDGDYTSKEALLKFIEDEKLSVVLHFGPHNFRKIGVSGKLLMIMALDNEDIQPNNSLLKMFQRVAR